LSGLQILMSALWVNPTIQELGLDDLRTPDDPNLETTSAGSLLATMVRSNTTLRRFTFRNNGLQSHELAELMSALGDNRTIQELRFSWPKPVSMTDVKNVLHGLDGNKSFLRVFSDAKSCLKPAECLFDALYCKQNLLTIIIILFNIRYLYDASCSHGGLPPWLQTLHCSCRHVPQNPLRKGV
jgi:hypothetical protein